MSRSSGGITSLVVVLLLFLGGRTGFADKLSDFQDAVKNDGCQSIPYSSERSTCESQQAYVHEWCDGSRGPVTCGSEGITRQLKDAIEKAKRDLDTAKDNKDKADRSKCIDYRQAVMDVFAAAIDLVRGESDPPEIVPLARQLRDKWEAGIPVKAPARSSRRRRY